MSGGDYHGVPGLTTVSGGGFYQAPHCPHCHQPMPPTNQFTSAYSGPLSMSIEVLQKMLADMTEAERDEWRRRSTVCGGAIPQHVTVSEWREFKP